jgi:hypothetical protein
MVEHVGGRKAARTARANYRPFLRVVIANVLVPAGHSS